MNAKRILLWLALVAIALAAAILFRVFSVSAHADLVSSTPSDKQVLPTAPTTVSLTFTDNLKPAPGSFIEVTNGGKDATTGAASISKTDTKTLTIPLQSNLAAGQYFVFWKSTSADDGGVSFGRFSFFVGTPAPSDVATAEAGVAVEIPDEAKNDALTGGKSSSNTGLVIGIVVAAVVGLALGGAGVMLVQRRGRA